MPKKSAVLQTQKKEVCDMYQPPLEMSISAISNETGIPVVSIYKILADAQIPLRGRSSNNPIEADPEKLAQAFERYINNDDIFMICRDANLSESQFYRLLNEAGIPSRKEQYKEEYQERLDSAMALYQDGVRFQDIVDRPGLSSSTINSERERRGIPSRRPRKERAAPTQPRSLSRYLSDHE